MSSTTRIRIPEISFKGVSDSPLGPFKDPIGKVLVNKNGWDDIDPTAFVDSTGQAYLYWGNSKLWYVKLNADMTSYTGDVATVPFSDESFGKRSVADTKYTTTYEEGPWFYKRNNLYYMVFAGGPASPEHIGYSTSSGPTGPWTYKGVIMSAQKDCAFTNHPGVCDFKGNSYFFYHNQALPGGDGVKRSVCVEQFSYKNDGTIPSITSTKNGPDQIGSLNPYDTVQAETICEESGVETEVCTEGGINVGSISNGDTIKVKGVDFGSGTGATSFMARVASSTSGGSIELRLDSKVGTLVGTCVVSGTGGAQKCVTKTCTVSGATGKHDLVFMFTGESGNLFNFNWWKFESPIVKQKVALKRGNVSAITMKICSGKTPALQLAIPESYLQGNLSVSLFDLNGRLVTTLISGQVVSQSLTLPLSKAVIKNGTYLVKVSINNDNSLAMAISL